MMVSLSRYFSCSSTKPGISALQGPHHVAQKFNSTTLPLYDASETSLPSRSFSLKSQLAGFALAMQPGVSAAADAGDSCEADGVSVACGAPGVASTCGSQTNGIAIASSAIAVTATAIKRMRECFGASAR